jgi:formate dehydrogenase subunit delta
MDIGRLVAMANDIAAFFDSEPDKAVAAEGVRFHLARFWDPRMRREIITHVNAGGGGLEPTARRAVELLAERPNSPNQSK